MKIMSNKTDTQVYIGGKPFTLSGYESEEYLQKVAAYINNKINEFNNVDGFKRYPIDTQNVLMQLNLADDYFKAKSKIDLLEQDLKAKDNELYDLKHELIATQMKLENTNKSLKDAVSKNSDLEKTIVRMDTQLKDLK